MSQFNNIMKQMQQVQAKLAEAQEKIPLLEATGTAGGGMVSVTVNGKGVISDIKIDKSLLNPDDGEILSDLIISAHSEAKLKLDEQIRASYPLDGMLPLDMKLPF